MSEKCLDCGDTLDALTDELPNLAGVTPLFVWDFWDLPLSGICKYRDETLFFTIARDPEDGTPPQYAVYRLPMEQAEYFVLEKAEFERLVGTSWSYAEDQPFRRIGGWSDRSDWHSFYDRPKCFKLEDELKRDTAELIGNFSWGPPTHT